MLREQGQLKLCSIDHKISMEEDACVSILRRNQTLERENEQLKQELLSLKAQITALQARDVDRRSTLLKKVQSFSKNSSLQGKQIIYSSNSEESLTVDGSFPKQEVFEPSTAERLPRVPKPPPRPDQLSLEPKMSGKLAQLPPPPPPPLPMKLLGRSGSAVRRVPEVVELYRSLTKREGKPDSLKTGASGASMVTNSREMIGEIENRSAYLIAIKSDVETQGEFISALAKEVQNAAYREISDVEAFVKWLDEELCYLVDERAVLKHFPHWPEQKADAMREAAFSYRDLKTLELEVSSFHVSMRQPVHLTLKHIQTLQDKVERGVHNLEKVRESSSKRYKDLQIPWEWMLHTGIIAQLKSGSMKLAKEYMTRVTSAMQSGAFSEEDGLLLHQGVRFAFRVHQFVGGFDEESRHAFQELKKLASTSHL